MQPSAPATAVTIATCWEGRPRNRRTLWVSAGQGSGEDLVRAGVGPNGARLGMPKGRALRGSYTRHWESCSHSNALAFREGRGGKRGTTSQVGLLYLPLLQGLNTRQAGVSPRAAILQLSVFISKGFPIYCKRCFPLSLRG